MAFNQSNFNIVLIGKPKILNGVEITHIRAKKASNTVMTPPEVMELYKHISTGIKNKIPQSLKPQLAVKAMASLNLTMSDTEQGDWFYLKNYLSKEFTMHNLYDYFHGKVSVVKEVKRKKGEKPSTEVEDKEVMSNLDSDIKYSYIYFVDFFLKCKAPKQ